MNERDVRRLQPIETVTPVLAFVGVAAAGALEAQCAALGRRLRRVTVPQDGVRSSQHGAAHTISRRSHESSTSAGAPEHPFTLPLTPVAHTPNATGAPATHAEQEQSA